MRTIVVRTGEKSLGSPCEADVERGVVEERRQIGRSIWWLVVVLS